jgi:hypothetical protein
MVRRRGSKEQSDRRLGPWLALAGTAITAIAAIIVALIARPAASSPSQTSQPNSDVYESTVAITSWSEAPLLSAPGERLTFVGIVTPVPPADSGQYVFVIDYSEASHTADESDTTPWLVSPPAKIESDGKWFLTWDLSDPPGAADWAAILVDSDVPPAAPFLVPAITCLPAPTPTPSSTDPDALSSADPSASRSCAVRTQPLPTANPLPSGAVLGSELLAASLLEELGPSDYERLAIGNAPAPESARSGTGSMPRS